MKTKKFKRPSFRENIPPMALREQRLLPSFCYLWNKERICTLQHPDIMIKVSKRKSEIQRTEMSSNGHSACVGKAGVWSLVFCLLVMDSQDTGVLRISPAQPSSVVWSTPWGTWLATSELLGRETAFLPRQPTLPLDSSDSHRVWWPPPRPALV